MLTMNQLKRRGHHLASRCPFCRKNEEELEHLLVHCPKIWGLWASLTSVTRAAWACPQTVRDLLLCWSVFQLGSMQEKYGGGSSQSHLGNLEGEKQNCVRRCYFLLRQAKALFY